MKTLLEIFYPTNKPKKTTMKEEINTDFISELMEFANENWTGFLMMLEERGYDGDPEEEMEKLDDRIYR